MAPETAGSTARVARLLRRLADRLDHRGAPKATHLWFTFEQGRGLVTNEDGRGCRLWYYGDDDYAKAQYGGRRWHLILLRTATKIAYLLPPR